MIKIRMPLSNSPCNGLVLPDKNNLIYFSSYPIYVKEPIINCNINEDGQKYAGAVQFSEE